MQLSAFIAEEGGTPQSLDVQADVTLGPDPAGGFAITGITLTVRGEVEGLDAAGFREGGAGGQGRLPGQQGAHRHDDHAGRRPGVTPAASRA